MHDHLVIHESAHRHGRGEEEKLTQTERRCYRYQRNRAAMSLAQWAILIEKRNDVSDFPVSTVRHSMIGQWR